MKWGSGLSGGRNLILIAVSLLIAGLLIKGADLLVGVLIPQPPLPYGVGLIFPPHTVQAYETTDFSYTATTNGIGLRDREITPAKSPGVVRIAVIGDSFTYGWGVTHEQTWCVHLERLLRDAGVNAEVVNAGKPGAGPPYYAEVAHRAIPLLNPDLVIVAMLQDDHVDLGAGWPGAFKAALFHHVRRLAPNITRWLRPVSSEPEVMRRNDGPAGRVISSAESLRQGNVKYFEKILAEADAQQKQRWEQLAPEVRQGFEQGLINPALLFVVLHDPAFYHRISSWNTDEIRRCIAQSAQCLAEVRHTAERCHAKMLITSVPLGPLVNREAHQNIQRLGYTLDKTLLADDGADHAIAAVAEMAGVPFLSVTQEFRNQIDTPGLYYPLDGHFAPEGHRLYAEFLTKKLLPFLSPSSIANKT